MNDRSASGSRHGDRLTPMQRLASVLTGRSSSRVLSRLRLRRLAAEDGAELIEFAVASTVFFLFVFGFVELCLVFFMYNTAAEAAREGSRWASVRGTTSYTTSGSNTVCTNPNITGCPATSTGVQNSAQTVPGASGMTITTSWCNSDGTTGCTSSNTNAKPGNIVKVTASYTFATVPFVTRSALTVSSTSEMVIWQ